MNDEEMKSQITPLETEKNSLIERIKELNKRLRYKSYELKALEPFLKQHEGVNIGPLRERKRKLDFRITTAAYTPKIERDLLKELKKIDDELAKYKDVEKGRRKERFVRQDIIDITAETSKIEERLKVIREELKVLYVDSQQIRATARKEAAIKAFKDDMATLEDMGIIVEHKGKKK
ncbi:MAG: hypothetical protein AABX38_00040 [Candidatus Micrarchaeota archaeon]